MIVILDLSLCRPIPLASKYMWFNRICLEAGENTGIDIEALTSHPDYERYAKLGVIKIVDEPTEPEPEPTPEPEPIKKARAK